MRHLSPKHWQSEEFALDTTPGLHFSIVPVDALEDGQHHRWRSLGKAAETNSPFAQPWFLRASLAHFAQSDPVMLAIVEDGAGWVGALPFIAKNWHGKMPLPHWSGWRHPNVFVGTPLIRQGDAKSFWHHVLAGLDSASPMRMVLELADLPVDDAATRALFSVCDEEERPFKIDRRFERARLDCRSESPVQWKASRRRRIASLERKLETLAGPLAFDVFDTPDDVLPAIEDFLRLEGAGWKGRDGCALSSDGDTADFFRTVAAKASARGEIAMVRLSAGGKTVAETSFFRRGRDGFGFKMAFDERYRKAAPGLLLLARLTRHLERSGSGIDRFDSCSRPDQEPVSSLWPDRRELVDCCIALGGPARRRMFGTIAAGDRLWRSLKTG